MEGFSRMAIRKLHLQAMHERHGWRRHSLRELRLPEHQRLCILPQRRELRADVYAIESSSALFIRNCHFGEARATLVYLFHMSVHIDNSTFEGTLLKETGALMKSVKT